MKPGGTKKIIDNEIGKLLFKPMSNEDAARLRRLDEEDSWLLAANLVEMDKRESDPDYDPADDPTCIRVDIENDEE